MICRSVRFGAATLLACAVVTTSIRPAAADEPAPSPAGATSGQEGGPTSGRDDDVKAEARLHFTAGVNLLQDPDKPRYEEAYSEFKHAYELAKSPSILGNIGLCAMKLERDAEAIEAYTRYLAEVQDLDPAERTQAERDLVTLKAGLARIAIETRPEGAVIRDTRIPSRGEPVTNSYGPIQGNRIELGLRRGHHVLKARFPDGTESASWEVEVNGGESHLFERPAQVPTPTQAAQAAQADTAGPARPIPRLVYAGGIATGALAIGTVVTGVLALNTNAKYESANDGTNRARAEDLQSTGETLNVVADVLLGATILAAAATTYLYLTRPAVAEQTPQGGRTGPGTAPRRAASNAPSPATINVFPGGISGKF